MTDRRSKWLMKGFLQPEIRIRAKEAVLALPTLLSSLLFAHCPPVSQKIREEYENGRDYYAIHGKYLAQPENALAIPSIESLNYHAGNVFRG